MKRTILHMLLIVVVSLLAAACTVPSALEPTPIQTVTAPTVTPPVAASSDVAFVTPLQPDVTEQTLDIYAPGQGGDWPVVLLLHGFDATKEYYAPLSHAIAEQGAVVFTAAWPTWIADLAARDNGKGFREMSEVLLCAIRFARAKAPDYGGDPSQVTLVGHSYGAGAGAWVALAGDDLDHSWEEFASSRGGPPPQVECVASRVSARVGAFVGIGGRYDLAGPLHERDAELWQVVNPYAHLGQNLDLRVRLIHGERDSAVGPEHAVQFNDALLEAGYDTSLTLWDGKHQVPIELTAAEVLKVVSEPAETPETAEIEPAGKPDVVNSFDAEGGEFPEGVAMDSVGNIYASLGVPFWMGGDAGEIRRISPNGTQTTLVTVAGPPAAGLAIDSAGTLFYAYPTGDERTGVFRVNDDGTAERLPGTENIVLPNGLAFDGQGNLYATDTILGTVWRIAPDGTGEAEPWFQHEWLQGCEDDPMGANGIALWQDSFYVASTVKGLLVRVPILEDGSAGEPELVAGSADCDAAFDELDSMDGIAVAEDGSIYALLVIQNKLVRIDPSDGSSTVLLTDADGLWNPASIIFGTGKDNQESIFISNFAVLPPEPANSLGPAVLEVDLGVQGLPLP